MFYEHAHLGSPDYLKIEQNENFSFPLHLHRCFEFFTVTKGEMKITIDGKESLLKKGQSVLIFPNQLHSIESVKSRHLLCIFSPELIRAFSASATGKIPKNNTFSPDSYLIKMLERFDTNTSVCEKKGFLYLLCAAFEKTADFTEKTDDKENVLSRIFSFVEDNFSADCSLFALSNSLGYDYAYLSRIFKKITGISYNSFVSEYRLSHACYLLENTSLSVLSCALDSGFISLRSFNRSFKRNFGITPTDFRNNQKK